MKIIPYKPEYRVHFEELNKAWVNKYFRMEPDDEWVLQHPQEAIFSTGGTILFVEHEDRIIGTVALKFVAPGVAEMIKMTVDENFRGLGAGKLLCRAAIEEARRLNAGRIILHTNSSLTAALGIYRQYGFTEQPVKDALYERADTRMELVLGKGDPAPVKWFERLFDFEFGPEQYDVICSRLQQAPQLLKDELGDVPEEVLQHKPGGTWSVKEHAGHLSLLEQLWRVRCLDILQQKPVLSPADLENKATTEAGFNKEPVTDLIQRFKEERSITLALLGQIDVKEDHHHSLHPRLQQPMRIIDLAYFVAEHDDHHLGRIRQLVGSKGQAEHKTGMQ